MIRILDIFQKFKNEQHNHIVKDIDLLDEKFYQNYFEFYPKLLTGKDVRYFKKSNCYAVFKFYSVKEVLQNKDFFSSENFKNDDKILLGADGTEHTLAKKAVTKNLDFLRENGNSDTELLINNLLDRLIENIINKEGGINVVDWIVNPFVLNLIMDKYGMLSHYPSLDILSKESTHEDKISNIQKLFKDRGLLSDISKESFKKKEMSPELLRLLSEFHENSFEEEDLIKFMNVFLQAGVLTTASLIASCILNIDYLDEKQINNDNHIDSFINEVLRLYSPSQFVFRRVAKKLQMDDIDIPVGSLVAVSIGAANRDETIFNDPLKFNMDRKEKHIAFGISTHKCIGERMALSVTKSFIRKFYIQYYKAKSHTIDSNLLYDNTIFIYKINQLIINQNTSLQSKK